MTDILELSVAEDEAQDLLVDNKTNAADWTNGKWSIIKFLSLHADCRINPMSVLNYLKTKRVAVRSIHFNVTCNNFCFVEVCHDDSFLSLLVSLFENRNKSKLKESTKASIFYVCRGQFKIAVNNEIFSAVIFHKARIVFVNPTVADSTKWRFSVIFPLKSSPSTALEQAASLAHNKELFTNVVSSINLEAHHGEIRLRISSPTREGCDSIAKLLQHIFGLSQRSSIFPAIIYESHISEVMSHAHSVDLIPYDKDLANRDLLVVSEKEMLMLNVTLGGRKKQVNDNAPIVNIGEVKIVIPGIDHREVQVSNVSGPSGLHAGSKRTRSPSIERSPSISNEYHDSSSSSSTDTLEVNVDRGSGVRKVIKKYRRKIKSKIVVVGNE
jgi:hypothetical protein